MFANNPYGDSHIVVWLPVAEDVQTALIEEAPEIYFRPPYVGANGWVGVELCKIDDQQLSALVREAFRPAPDKMLLNRVRSELASWRLDMALVS